MAENDTVGDYFIPGFLYTDEIFSRQFGNNLMESFILYG
jgi:hypothetical protein